MVKKPIIDLEAANPRLYSFVDELALVKVWDEFWRCSRKALIFHCSLYPETSERYDDNEGIHPNVQGCTWEKTSKAAGN